MIKRAFFWGLAVTLILSLSIQFASMDKYPLPFPLNYWYIFPAVVLISYIILTKYKVRRLDSFRMNLVILSGLLFFILFRAGLFSAGPINIQDYPLHYFAAYNMAQNLFPNFQSTIGPTQHFQLGYTLHFDYPILAPVMTVLTFYTLQSVPLWAVFRFIVGFSFCLPVFALYFLSRKLGFDNSMALLASLFSISWTNMHFIAGMYSSYLSLGLGLLAIYLLVDFFQSGKKYLLPLSAIMAGLSFLAHSLIFVPFLLTYSILLLIERKKICKMNFLMIILIFVGISIFYPVAILNRFDYVTYMFSRFPEAFTHLYDVDNIFWNVFYFDTPLIILLSLPILLLDYDNRHLDAFLYAAISLIALTLVLGQIQVPTQQNNLLNILVNTLETDRVLFFSRPLWSLLCVYVISSALKMEGARFRVIGPILLGAVFLFIAPYMVYMSNGWHSSDDQTFSDFHKVTLGEFFALDYDNGVLEFRPKPDVVSTYEFLIENSDNSARVLWEDSTSGRAGGNIKSMASYFTDRLFVGSVYIGVILEGNEGAHDSIFFGKKVDEYEISELEETLDDFNVGWIVVWTNISKDYFDTKPDFRKAYESPDGLIWVYNYSLSKRNFVLSGDAELLELLDNRITIGVRNRSNLLLSFRYEPDWHAYLNNEEIPLGKEGILMALNASTGTLEIVYKENLFTKTAKYVTIFSFSISLLFSIFLFKRSRSPR